MKRIRTSLISILVVLICLYSFSGCNTAAKYMNKANEVVSKMLQGASYAEEVGGLIHDVWYNTIYEISDSTTDAYTKVNKYSNKFNKDFNTSIGNLFSDSSFKAKRILIQSNQDTVQSLMKELSDPPSKCSTAFNAIKDLYGAYNDLVGLALNPTGNLASFTNSFNTADTDVVKYYKIAKLYID